MWKTETVTIMGSSLDYLYVAGLSVVLDFLVMFPHEVHYVVISSKIC